MENQKLQAQKEKHINPMSDQQLIAQLIAGYSHSQKIRVNYPSF